MSLSEGCLLSFAEDDSVPIDGIIPGVTGNAAVEPFTNEAAVATLQAPHMVKSELVFFRIPFVAFSRATIGACFMTACLAGGFIDNDMRIVIVAVKPVFRQTIIH